MLELARLLILIAIVNSCVIPKNTIKSSFIDYKAVTASSIALLLSPSIVKAQPLLATECDNPVYKKSVFNIPPAAFKFPTHFEGVELNDY
jgi:hypothetical protein